MMKMLLNNSLRWAFHLFLCSAGLEQVTPPPTMAHTVEYSNDYEVGKPSALACITQLRVIDLSQVPMQK